MLNPILPVNNNSHFSSYRFNFYSSFLGVQDKTIQVSENMKQQTESKSFFPVFLLTRNIQLTELDTPDNSEWDPEGRSESEKTYFHLRKNPLFLRSATPDWWALNYRVLQKRVGNANEYRSLLGFHGQAQKPLAKICISRNAQFQFLVTSIAVNQNPKPLPSKISAKPVNSLSLQNEKLILSEFRPQFRASHS